MNGGQAAKERGPAPSRGSALVRAWGHTVRLALLCLRHPQGLRPVCMSCGGSEGIQG